MAQNGGAVRSADPELHPRIECSSFPPLPCRRISAKTVVLCGVQTPNCIRATAVDALGLDYEVAVLTDATASKSEQVQENNLEGEVIT